MSNLVCKCSEIIIKSNNNGECKVRSKILLFRDEKAFAVCKKCNSEIEVPLSIKKSAIKSSPRIFVNK